MSARKPTFVQTIVHWDALDPEDHPYIADNGHRVGATSVQIEITTDSGGTFAHIKTLSLGHDKNGALRKIPTAGEISKDHRPAWAVEMLQVAKVKHAGTMDEPQPETIAPDEAAAA